MHAESDFEWPFDKILTELADSMKNYENLQASLLDRLQFRRFEPEQINEEFRQVNLTAVDSSSASIVDAGCFIVIAYRVGAVKTKGDELAPFENEASFPIQMALINNSESSAEKNFLNFTSPLLEAMQSPESSLPILTPQLRQPRPRDIDWLQLVRSAEEWREVRNLLDVLKPGDFILRDGPLRADIRIPSEIVESILKLAAERGIHIIGITKRSSVPVGPGQLMPIVPAIQKLGTAELPESCWFTPLPDDQNTADIHPYNFGNSYIVRYHPLSQYVFWTDINKFDTIKPEETFAKISTISNDPVYIGYPYPLAIIHNNVALTRTIVEDLKYYLQSVTFESNTLTPRSWELLFQDFHEILDINVY